MCRTCLFPFQVPRVVGPFVLRTSQLLWFTAAVGSPYYCLSFTERKGEGYQQFSDWSNSRRKNNKIGQKKNGWPGTSSTVLR